MSGKLQKYEGAKITVTFDKSRCIHVAECLRGLPAVFDTSQRVWIALDNADAAQVAETVERCPSGALQYQFTGAAVSEIPPEHITVVINPHGPIYVRGNIEMVDAEGKVLAHATRVSLCRCGKSNNKPYCDNQHIEIKFRDKGEIPEGIVESTGGDMPSGSLRIEFSKDGPIGMIGPMTLSSRLTKESIQTNEAWFCRCGGSGTKPFCDSTHQMIGFKGE